MIWHQSPSLAFSSQVTFLCPHWFSHYNMNVASTSWRLVSARRSTWHGDESQHHPAQEAGTAAGPPPRRWGSLLLHAQPCEGEPTGCTVGKKRGALPPALGYTLNFSGPGPWAGDQQIQRAQRMASKDSAMIWRIYSPISCAHLLKVWSPPV